MLSGGGWRKKRGGRTSEIFHNEFIRSLAGWLTIGLVAMAVLKFVIQFYQGNEISITLSLAEIIIAASIASAIMSILAFARSSRAKRNTRVLAESFIDKTIDLNNRLKKLEEIEENKFPDEK